MSCQLCPCCLHLTAGRGPKFSVLAAQSVLACAAVRGDRLAPGFWARSVQSPTSDIPLSPKDLRVVRCLINPQPRRPSLVCWTNTKRASINRVWIRAPLVGCTLCLHKLRDAVGRGEEPLPWWVDQSLCRIHWIGRASKCFVEVWLLGFTGVWFRGSALSQSG